MPKDQVTEVLVEGEKQRTSPVRLNKNRLVRDPRAHLRDIQHLVPLLAQMIDDGPIHPFVTQKDQAASSGNRYVTSARRASAA